MLIEKKSKKNVFGGGIKNFLGWGSKSFIHLLKLFSLGPNVFFGGFQKNVRRGEDFFLINFFWQGPTILLGGESKTGVFNNVKKNEFPPPWKWLFF